MNRFKVSVRLMTFNHAPYLAQALEGIFRQKVKFRVEVVVGDDFSTDETMSILSSFSDTDEIKLRVLERPIGGKYWELRTRFGRLYNFVDIVSNCSGEYVALLDGDDFWTDEMKLQKQVDFLDANPDFSICFHDVEFLHENGAKSASSSDLQIYDAKDLAKGNFIYSASCLFRRREKIFPKWFCESPVGDYALHLLNARFGKIKRIPESMAVYRVHSGGVWGTKGTRFQIENWIQMLEYLLEEFRNQPDVREVLLQQQFDKCVQLAEIYFNESEYDKLSGIMIRALSMSNSSASKWFIDYFSLKKKHKALKAVHSKLQTSPLGRLQRLINDPAKIFHFFHLRR